MNYAFVLAFGVLCAAVVTPLQAADAPKSAPDAPKAAAQVPKGALCALADIQECDTGKACERVSAEDIAAPRFIRVELTKRTLQGIGPRAQDRVSKIETVRQHGDVVFAQGVDDGADSKRGALGWILALDSADGSMQLTAMSGDSTFVASGECLLDK